ncbi:MAG: NAD(+)/NADH kinase [Lachnospiraceae bacterium]|nr:NAD(+)/NADH kinase [Lachnospiraceae bacterium]
MRKYVILRNEEKEDSLNIALETLDYIKDFGGEADIIARNLDTMREPIDVDDDVDCVIVLGGDGSILRTVRGLNSKSVPIVGVNLGHLGFLTQTEPAGIKKLVSRLMNDEYRIDERMMLEGTVTTDGKVTYSDISLNDIVISRSGISRIVKIGLYVNGELLDNYEADGVVISTPTGSTAYNLSAGGPVVCPSTHLMVVTPISPHALSARSVVLSDKDELKVVIEEIRTSPKVAYITFDGQIGRPMAPSDSVVIKKSSSPAKLIRVREESFYEVLRTKMR